MTVRRWTDTARRLRREMSLPEVLLWREMRGGPAKFRRQHAVGDHVVDFYCAAAKLAVEVDGWSHTAGDRPLRGETRDAWLAERGIRVVRVGAPSVLSDPAGVAAWLAAEAAILPARGEVARSGGGEQAAAAPRPNPPPSRFACHLPAGGEDRVLPGVPDRGLTPCR